MFHVTVLGPPTLAATKLVRAKAADLSPLDGAPPILYIHSVIFFLIKA